MGNESWLYVGPYIEVTLDLVPTEVKFNLCSNGHSANRNEDGRVTWGNPKTGFCTKCGSPFEITTKTEMQAPSKWLVLTDEMADRLSDSTPAALDKTPTTLLLTSNARSFDWMYYNRWADSEVKAMPTSEEIAARQNDMAVFHESDIDVIKGLSFVKSVSIKSGFLACSER